MSNEHEIMEEMDEEQCPVLEVGHWVIVTDKGGLWGIDAYSFETSSDAKCEAMGDIYLSKEIVQLTSDNIADFQKKLEQQWHSDTELI